MFHPNNLQCSTCSSHLDSIQQQCCIDSCVPFPDKIFIPTQRCKCSSRPQLCVHERALATLPEVLNFKADPESLQLGVVSRVAIPSRAIFGPIVAPFQPRTMSSFSAKYAVGSNEYGWNDYLLDRNDLCNWMKFVCQAENSKEHNLTAFQFKGSVYFAAIKDIPHSQELRVWYANNYAAVLGHLLISKFKEHSVIHSISQATKETEMEEDLDEILGLEYLLSVEEMEELHEQQVPERTGSPNPGGIELVSKDLSKKVETVSCANFTSSSLFVVAEELCPASNSMEFVGESLEKVRRKLKKRKCRTVKTSTSAMETSGSVTLASDVNSKISSGSNSQDTTKSFCSQHHLRPKRKCTISKIYTELPIIKKAVKTESQKLSEVLKTSNSKMAEKKSSQARYACIYCSEPLPSSAYYQAHYVTHRVDGRFPCPKCPNKTYLDHRKVLKHFSDVHALSYTCNICDHVFGRSYLLDKHMAVHVKSTSHCATCNKSFRRKSRLLHHIATVHPENSEDQEEPTSSSELLQDSKVSAEDADQEQTSESSNLHTPRKARKKTIPLRKHEKPRCICMYCSKELPNTKTLAEHGSTHDVSGVFSCPVGMNTYGSHPSAMAHFNREPKSNLLICLFCDFTTKTERELKIHEDQHCTVSGYQCNLCKMKLKTEGALQSHTCDTHDHDSREKQKRKSGVGKLNIKCVCCFAVFDNRANFYEHVQTHCVDGMYPCRICKKTFDATEKVRWHIYKVHTKPSNDKRTTPLYRGPSTSKKDNFFKCRECKLSFFWRKGLICHMESVHPNASTSAVSELNLPLRQVDGFKCTKCKSYFYVEDSAKDHAKHKHGDEGVIKPLVQEANWCEICDMPFRGQKKFKEHAKLHPDYLSLLMPDN